MWASCSIWRWIEKLWRNALEVVSDVSDSNCFHGISACEPRIMQRFTAERLSDKQFAFSSHIVYVVSVCTRLRVVTLIRHDSSVFCRDFVLHPDGETTLWRVFSELNVDTELPDEPQSTLVLNPPAWLVSSWLIEKAADMKLYTAHARWLAPNDHRVLRETSFELDFRQAFRYVYRLQIGELDFVGEGQYEYHIEILSDAGWGEISRNSLFITNDVSR